MNYPADYRDVRRAHPLVSHARQHVDQVASKLGAIIDLTIIKTESTTEVMKPATMARKQAFMDFSVRASVELTGLWEPHRTSDAVLTRSVL